MPFNTLLLTCLIPGTSFSEAGGRVSVRPESGETVLFFSIDDHSNPNSALRQHMNITGPICDLIVFYSRGDKKVLCLVELKGKNLKHAIEQITNTFQFLRPNFNRYPLRQIDWKACILQHGSALKRAKQLRQALQQAFGKDNFLITRNGDVGQFLRG